MPPDGGLQFGRRGREGQFNPVGELEIERFSLRLHGVHDLADEALGDELRRELAGHDHDGPRPLRRGPALLRGRTDHHIVLLDDRLAAASERDRRPAIPIEGRQQRNGIGLCDRVAGLWQILPEPRAQLLEIRQHGPRDVAVGLAADLELLDVEFVTDEIGVGLEPGSVGGVTVSLGEDHLHLRERLADLELLDGAGGPAQRRNVADDRHAADEVLIDEGLAPDRIVGEVHTLGHGSAEGSDRQILPDRLADERNEGRGEPRDRQQCFVERPIGIELGGVALRPGVGPARGPEAVAAATDEPVADGIDERGKRSGGAEVVVAVHAVDHGSGSRVELRQHPAIQLATVGDGPVAAGPRQIGMLQGAGSIEERRRIEAIDPRVDHEEAVDIPEPQQELGHTLPDRPLAVADARPRRLAGEEKPPQRVGPILVEDLGRLAVVPLALAHLLAVFAEHVPEHDAGAEGMRVGRLFVTKQQRADRQLAVEPAAGLVDRLGDEVGGKLGLELLVTAVRPAPLGKRHGTGVEPAVDDFRHTPHPGSRCERGVVGDRVDVGLVHAEIVGEFRIRGLRPVKDVGALHAWLGRERRIRRHRLGLAGRLTLPDRQRRAPIPLARESPIDIRLQEVAEPAVLDVLGQPVDPGVVGEHLLAELARADKPALSGILDQRIVVGPPAERIVVDILLLVHEQMTRPQVAGDVAVALLHEPAAPHGEGVGEAAVGGDAVDERRPSPLGEPCLLGGQHRVVDLAEGRRDVDDAGA